MDKDITFHIKIVYSEHLVCNDLIASNSIVTNFINYNNYSGTPIYQKLVTQSFDTFDTLTFSLW